jgi:hypothetical protein
MLDPDGEDIAPQDGWRNHRLIRGALDGSSGIKWKMMRLTLKQNDPKRRFKLIDYKYEENGERG